MDHYSSSHYYSSIVTHHLIIGYYLTKIFSNDYETDYIAENILAFQRCSKIVTPSAAVSIQ